MHLKTLSVKWQPFCPRGDELAWWCHGMDKLFELLAFCGGNPPASIAVHWLYFVSQNKLLNKQSVCQWFEILCHSCDVSVMSSRFSVTGSYLTHWGRDKMAAIFQTTFSNAFSGMKTHEFQLKISLKFVPKGAINNIPVLVQIMAWHRPGNIICFVTQYLDNLLSNGIIYPDVIPKGNKISVGLS